MKAKFLLLLCVAMLSLIGCTDSSADNIDPPGSNDDSKGIDELEVNESYGEPPALTIRIDGETIRPVLGSYNWMTEYDDDTAREIYATSLPPPELVKKVNHYASNQGPKWNLISKLNRMNTGSLFGKRMKK